MKFIDEYMNACKYILAIEKRLKALKKGLNNINPYEPMDIDKNTLRNIKIEGSEMARYAAYAHLSTDHMHSIVADAEDDVNITEPLTLNPTDNEN